MRLHVTVTDCRAVYISAADEVLYASRALMPPYP